jgi:hypothetical protein
MKRLVVCLALLLLAPAARAETPSSDPKAVAIADQVMKALGGRERWDSLEGLRWAFEFAVNDTVKSSRSHSCTRCRARTARECRSRSSSIWMARAGWHG